MRALILALLLAASQALALEMRATDQAGTSVRITDAACTNEAVLERLKDLPGDPLPREAFHAARVVYQGREYQACWAPIQNYALVIDDGGVPESIFIVPRRDFVVVQSI